MNELILFDNENGEQFISARELHKALNIKERFNAWFSRFKDLFVEGVDFTGVDKPTVVNNGATITIDDYQITVDMAKHIALMSKTESGKKVRQYLIDLEKAWNTPEQVMARALKVADKTIAKLQTDNQLLIEKNTALFNDNQRMKPKEIFADAVSTSKDSILVRDLAKLISQNGCEIGGNRLFQYLRENGYLIKNGTSRNTPMQKYLEMGLFEVKETTRQNPDGTVRLNFTTKVTGKGQRYFVDKFLNDSGKQLSVADLQEII